MLIRLLKPNVASFGYALFLAINATTIWGGSFPFLPIEFQTFEILTSFFLIQSIAFWGSFLVCMAHAYLFPRAVTRRRIALFVIPLLIGSLNLIAPLYLPDYTLALVICGGLLLGLGSAGFFLLWQRAFASKDPERGNLDLMLGTGFSALIYAALHLIPIAVAAFVIALILIPLAGLCLLLASREIDYAQPMFEDIPRDNAQTYRKTLGSQWKSALCVGSLAFASGIIRALALEDPSMGLFVNFTSMAGALASAFALIFWWQRYSFRFDTILAYRTIFPLIITLFLCLPFFGEPYLRIFAGILYMLFAFATMITMIQCAQISRDYGINPLFVFGFFGAIVYSLQSFGFIIGYFQLPFEWSGLQHLAVIALVSIWLLAITLYFVRGHLRQGSDEAAEHMSSIEFIALAFEGQTPQSAEANIETPAQAQDDAEKHYRDRLAKRLATIAPHYRLTARETEIIELIARGNSIARIAEILVVSENTVRTHSKRSYIKLGIHRRQGLLDLLEDFSQD